MADNTWPLPWRQALQHALLRAWQTRGPLAAVLYPVSLLYRSLSALRRLGFGCGLLRVRRCPVTVVVIGNVVAGGAGKTPTVMAVVQHLQAKHVAVGVISRGYGRQTDNCREVYDGDHPDNVGDEPLLIRSTLQVPVFVASTRHAAAMALLEKYPQTQILVCDDGLQHYGLYRDLEVCVFDDRGCGNDWLLPAGPLREAWPRKPVARCGQRQDRLVVLHTGHQPAFAGHRVHKSLAATARNHATTGIPLADLPGLSGKPLLAVAGIAQPETFFAMLRDRGLPLSATRALPDHYRFDSEFAIFCGGYQVICTDKDAAKLWPWVPQAVAVGLVFEPESAFFSELDHHLEAIQSAKLSSTHGHQTS